jgi:cysteine desulfurase/selenocysteine lyase
MNEASSQRPTPERALALARRSFPGAERWVYMNVAARGLISKETRAAVDRHLDERMMDGGDKAAMFQIVESARRRYARLINAADDEVAMTKNISDGLNMVAAALPWRAGDNAIFAPALEHANNFYPWLNLRQRLGVEVRAIPAAGGHAPVEAMIRAMDARTRVVAVSTVTFSPGFRTDVETLGRACRERGVLLLADGAQSVGILHTDVKKTPVDALVTSTQKGLLAFYGMGFLYCRKEWAERLTPAYLARFGVDLGGLDEASSAGERYRLMPGARRFDLGNYNFLGAVAADASLGQLLEIGTPAIEGHVTRLARRLADGLLQLGLPVQGGPSGPHLAGIVSVGRIGSGHDASEDPEMEALHRHLADNGVKLSVRRGMLRFSLHLYNDDADVGRVLDLARGFLARRRKPD